MAAESLKHFNNVVEIPYTIITIFYVVAKLVIIATPGIRLLRAKYISSKCCKSKCSSCWTDLNRWMIRVIFGKSGILHVDKDNNVYFADCEVKNDFNINILATIIICFILLIMIIAYSTFLLDVTNTCSENYNIHCFPILISEDNPDNPNITQSDMEQRITNCDDWDNSTVSFLCYRYAYNTKDALAVAGGLLAVFIVTMNTTISILLKISSYKGFKVLRYVALVILVPFNLFAAIFTISLVLNDQLGTNEFEDEYIAIYTVDNGIQFLITSGTVELLLLVPWEKIREQGAQ